MRPDPQASVLREEDRGLRNEENTEIHVDGKTGAVIKTEVEK